jgi:hypothetical protein
MAKLFISHATADLVLIDPFVELLQTGLNIRQEDIFCSSCSSHTPKRITDIRTAPQQVRPKTCAMRAVHDQGAWSMSNQ